ncbi:Bacteriophytochrome (light-regulated signal transduction histidine kinase) [Faunimonas pinastri]|uniref:Bacteriophytochrome (Light-regulated signal transduction histidine kinase) n=1 Tax=Faunimonas pinastri TaxID=1855383 RepID=A0A1H9FYH9_9HYPH|nr:histidine kinase dimerization/phosphoacceptor domain -containing protein [Faunimonas pinastri]SEQ42920.1 Bacteriophytochrome (light-regulated signal transduction histidine kinase) [Faunimonas pinastri]
MNIATPPLTVCDREPIHIPGSIQPHGIMLVFDPETLGLRQAAGMRGLGFPPASRVGDRAADILDEPLVRSISEALQWQSRLVTRWLNASGAAFDVSAHRSGDSLIVELEPAGERPPGATDLLSELDRATASFERASTLRALCQVAATAVRDLTGFERVMIYRFEDGHAGSVIAEDCAEGLQSFLNHHFPGSDIPQQARALYVRNTVRVIPDAEYYPAELQPPLAGEKPLDMSDCILRSVSPIHLQYLRNMGVWASASVSIVVDGALWGLIACHHTRPREISYPKRSICAALAGNLARRIRAMEESELYRQRASIRSREDDLLFGMVRDPEMDGALPQHTDTLLRMLDADGVAIVRGESWRTAGRCPPEHAMAELAAWAAGESAAGTLATHNLSAVFAPAASYASSVSGLVAVTISEEEPFVVMWFRQERIETINWAGNPHKAVELQPGEILTPRSSFDAWSETVRGQSRRWSLAETESAGRFRQRLYELRQLRRMRDVNVDLSRAVAERDVALRQKEILLREVNHRVQNSLFLVSNFLHLQKRDSENPELHGMLDEARRRVSAVGLVHRRLYRADQIDTVDLDRYLVELRDEMVQSMGKEWDSYLTLSAAPVLVATDRAVTLGLVITELVINANKYAYGGGMGPIDISLRGDHANLQLAVSDQGRGAQHPKGGFGTRMMDALVGQIGGRLEYQDNHPGLRAVLTAPVA